MNVCRRASLQLLLIRHASEFRYRAGEGGAEGGGGTVSYETGMVWQSCLALPRGSHCQEPRTKTCAASACVAVVVVVVRLFAGAGAASIHEFLILLFVLVAGTG
jgi:hypothetical protein